MNPTGRLYTIGDQRAISDNRISAERPYTKDWNLHIREVRQNDSGQYKCNINTVPVKSMKVYLSVQGKYLEMLTYFVVCQNINKCVWKIFRD